MELPSEWKDVLSKVQGAFPGAVIAGGALRDTLLGKPIKDVDIFVPITDLDVETKVYELFPKARLHKSTTYGIKETLEDTDRDIYAIYNLGRDETMVHLTPEQAPEFEYQYDLILATPQACDINTFDINICQIVYDGVTLHKTPAFLEGVETKTIRVMNVNRTDRNQKRLERIAAKYPEYTTQMKETTDEGL